MLSFCGLYIDSCISLNHLLNESLQNLKRHLAIITNIKGLIYGKDLSYVLLFWITQAILQEHLQKHQALQILILTLKLTHMFCELDSSMFLIYII